MLTWSFWCQYLRWKIHGAVSSSQKNNGVARQGRRPGSVEGSRLSVNFVSAFVEHYCAPHIREVFPSGVSCCPRYTGTQGVELAWVVVKVPPPTHHHLPTRQEREAVIKSWSRQLRDGAQGGVHGAGGKREDVDPREHRYVVPAANSHMTWWRLQI